MVGTKIQMIQLCLICFKHLIHSIMTLNDEGFWEKTSSDSGLIRDDNEKVSAITQDFQSIRYIWIKSDIVETGEIVNIMYQDTVSIKENSYLFIAHNFFLQLFGLNAILVGLDSR